MLYTLVVVLSVLALVQSHEGHDHQDEGPAKFHIDPKDEHMKEWVMLFNATFYVFITTHFIQNKCVGSKIIIRHLKEHLDEMADDVKLETDNDVYFGYFNVHDNNKDGFLDGLELLNSFAG